MRGFFCLYRYGLTACPAITGVLRLTMAVNSYLIVSTSTIVSNSCFGNPFISNTTNPSFTS